MAGLGQPGLKVAVFGIGDRARVQRHQPVNGRFVGWVQRAIAHERGSPMPAFCRVTASAIRRKPSAMWRRTVLCEMPNCSAIAR